MPLAIEVEGLERVLEKLQPSLVAEPLRGFLNRAAITVQTRARAGAPVDTGHLRAMIGYEVDSAAMPAFARIGFIGAEDGSPLWFKARAMEYGTGSQGDEVSHAGGHWPPGAALDVWAQRHGMASGWAVAGGIGRRGGLRPRRFLRNAIAQSMAEILGMLEQMRAEIAARWGGG